MTRHERLIGVGASVLAMSAAVMLSAQTKTVTGQTKTITAEVEAIESSSREVTVKKPDGTYDVWYVPPGVKKFESLKIGDAISARYYENMVVTVKPAGAAPRNDVNAAVTRTAAGATVGHQRTITATVTAIDRQTPSITFTGPHDWKYSTRVEDKDALSTVKVGDKVDITWTEATIVSLGGSK